MKGAARFAIAIAVLLGVAEKALAGQHTWDVNEVFSDATGNIQFVELWETDGGAGEVNIHVLSVTSTTETFPIGGSALTPPTSNKFFLIATPAFAALPGAPTPDRILPPDNIPFFSTAGDTVSFVPYDSWNFGTVPTDGVNSLNRIGGQAAATPTNYAGDTNAAPIPALEGLGVWLVVGLLLLAGTAIVLRSRAKTA
jgi:hypothetical protein